MWQTLISGHLDDGSRAPEHVNPMLRESPWLLLAFAGAVVVIRAWRRWDWLLATAAISAVASIYYFAYYAGGGDDLQYSNFRFFVAWLPVWALLAFMSIPDARCTSSEDTNAAESAPGPGDVAKRQEQTARRRRPSARHLPREPWTRS
jgi:hypothetical protein